MTMHGWMRRRRPKGSARTQRRGAALVEVMVAMVVVTIGLLGAGGMTAVAARKASALSYQSRRDGIVLEEMNRIAALTYDSLASRVGCTTVTGTTLAHTRCISVTNIAGGAGYKRVRLIITPAATSYARAETVYVNRAKGAARNPLAP